MLKQRYYNEALFPYQGPVIVRPRLASSKKSIVRREKRQLEELQLRFYRS